MKIDNGLAQPYTNDPDGWDELTVGRLRQMLGSIPDNYIVRYDGFCAGMNVKSFTIDHKNEEISING